MILADTRASADTPEAIEGRKRMLQVVREKGADAVAEDLLLNSCVSRRAATVRRSCPKSGI